MALLLALTTSVVVVSLLGGIAMKNLLPLLVYFACSMWRSRRCLKFCCSLRFVGVVFSCGGGLAVASLVRVLFCFFSLINFCKLLLY